jgi:hypothetical protein
MARWRTSSGPLALAPRLLDTISAMAVSIRIAWQAAIIALVGLPAVSFAQVPFVTVTEGHLSASEVVPPTPSAAYGSVTISLTSDESSINAAIYYTNLSGGNTAVHIHGPAQPGQNGPVIFTVGGSGFTSAVIHAVRSVNATQAAELKAGLWYVDVTSPTYPDGEIRGQLRLGASQVASMDGAQPVPASGAGASGFGRFAVDTQGSAYTIVFMFTFSDLSGNSTAVHTHGPAQPGLVGPAIHTLGGVSASAGTYIAFSSISPAELAELRAGLWYFDIHSAAFPEGEIRGQIKPADKTTDFDGDSRAEIGVFRGTSGTWYLQNPATSAFTAMQFGMMGDVYVPADFDGDGRTDRAVWRSGVFYVWLSRTGALQAQPWGMAGDDPRVSGDYDGDGRADFAVYRPAASPGGPSFLYVLQTSDGGVRTIQWGTQGDLAQLGDYDGDRKRDAAIYRPATGTFYVLRSGPLGFLAQPFGTLATDRLTPGDYDADGKTDFAVWRYGGPPPQGAWYVLQSSTGILRGEVFGVGSDSPVPADFDGDGKTDLAVVRAAGGILTWYIMQSATATFFGLPFGLVSDEPIQRYVIR